MLRNNYASNPIFSQMARRLQGKSYCFTINNPFFDITPESIEEDFPNILFMVCQHEIGDGTEGDQELGQKHIQGTCEFNANVRGDTFKNMFDDEGVHIELRRENRKANVLYCSKDRTRDPDFDTVWYPSKEGVEQLFKRVGRGKRTDLDNYVQAIVDGKKKYELLEEFPRQTLMYGGRHRQTVLNHMKQPDFIDHPKDCVVYFGKTGVGKSYRVAQECEDPSEWFRVAPSEGGTAWFDGYEGQPGLIFDEIRDHWFKWHILLRILEYQPHKQVQIKGSTVYLKAYKFKLTTNIHPKKWYPRARGKPNSPWNLSPLRKRMSLIEKMDVLYVDPNGLAADDCVDEDEPSNEDVSDEYQRGGFIGQNGQYYRN